MEKEKMKIGNLKLDSKLILAPMAAVNCASFRLLCREQGAGLVSTPMIVMNQLVNQPETIIERTCFLKKEKPISVQLVGSDPKLAKQATKIIEPYADIIDVNMGCPERDILALKAGSFLVKHPEQIEKIMSSIISSTNLPVTAKIRTGWDKNSVNTLKVVKILENLGVDAIAIHGRTREQKYEGKADWNEIKKAKEQSNIPIIGNGDIFKPGTAKAMIDFTKCDFVMIGRASMGNPFIFKRTKALLETGKNVQETPTKEKLQGFLKFIEYYDKYEHLRRFSELKQHSMWFFKEIDNSKKIKSELMQTKSLEEIKKIYNRELNKI